MERADCCGPVRYQRNSAAPRIAPFKDPAPPRTSMISTLPDKTKEKESSATSCVTCADKPPAMPAAASPLQVGFSLNGEASSSVRKKDNSAIIVADVKQTLPPDHYGPRFRYILGHYFGGISSAQTRNPDRVAGPNVWVSGTSAASRPCAMRIRPIRGALLRGSKAYQRSPR